MDPTPTAMLDATGRPSFDWKAPNYLDVFAERTDRLRWLNANPREVDALRKYYATHVADFINDWGVTIDPRNAGTATPVVMPFLLFDRQRELIDWFERMLSEKKPGVVEKSRDVGASWLAMAYAASLCLLRRHVTIGIGSAKEDKVDLAGDPNCLMYKARQFITNLPPQFSGGWSVYNKQCSSHLRIVVPGTDSAMVGEAGDNIGRGGRSTMYIIDESAHVEHPKMIDASLSANTDVRIDMSSVQGMANSFAEKRHSFPDDQVFIFDWRQDPRKDDAWYDRKCAQIGDPVIVAQEIDRNYAASVEGVVIPSMWVQACINADKKLGLTVTGTKTAALDVADQGRDLNAFGERYGAKLTHALTWSGQAGDIFATTERAFLLCDQRHLDGFCYDADGLGAGVRGDARKINERRMEQKMRRLSITQFRGSAAVMDPEKCMVEGRKNKDLFKNYKAQSWWALRFRAFATYNWVVKGIKCDPDDLLILSGDLKELARLTSELSQPVWKLDNAGKIVIDKVPDGMMSPNLADMVMMLFAPKRPALKIADSMLDPTNGD